MKLETYITLQNQTAKEFGDLIGVSRVSIERYKSGTRIPSRRVLIEIERVTNGAVQPNDFYDTGESA